jgi:hypothetical protein
MRKLLLAMFIAVAVGAPASAGAQEAPQGAFSLATNPPVMVYIDGQRVGMTPILNRQLPVGEHRVTLLLVRPGGERLRADYQAVIAADRSTFASLDMVRDAPTPGEVRTLSPEPQPAVATPAPPPQPPQPVAPEAQPVRPLPPVEVASLERPAQEVAVVASPPPLVDENRPAPVVPTQGLSREMVREGMEALRPVVERCMAGASGIVQVRLMIQPDGSVSDVETQGIYHETVIGECIQNGFPDEAAFPIYSGDPIPVVYPFRVAGE